MLWKDDLEIFLGISYDHITAWFIPHVQYPFFSAVGRPECIFNCKRIWQSRRIGRAADYVRPGIWVGGQANYLFCFN